ncbi:nuclear transport factor 2 family protein [Kitasatospora sp. NBC_01250]|uniref:nuclear transport factor 2 family protein n=1 Tax=unclassified Kitasatospora TaxID=2633591 RepID=UPI002E133361|nr:MULTISPECIES: nuclear transport factor 2 family protein [unclassified Kitasatospora]WSJ66698.1 nuclear transport factor 2 family protein [Kitasatospora sp. NBC_01302]
MALNRAEKVREYYERVDAADYEAVFEMFCDDVVYERGGTEPIVGMEEFKRFYLADRIIESGRHEVEAVVDNGDWVAARGVFSGRLKNAELVTVRWADFHLFKGEKIWRRYTYFADRAV